MTTMDGFDHILNWKLRQGSHRFPGKDGGTCINEAAVVAADFDYRPIRRVEDMPECFSRPICRLAMQLNDIASNAQRQRLLPFVAWLACADTPEIERERASYIEAHTRMFFSFEAFEEGLQSLEGALAIGRRADPLGRHAVKARLDAVQGQATTAKSVPDSHLFFEVKSWLESKKVSELLG
jgi:hypothetical protein